MKIPKHLKPESLITDRLERTIAAPYLEISQQGARGTRKGHIVATSGRHIVCFPVEVEDGDTSGFIPASALETARKLSEPDKPAELLAMERIVHRNMTTEPRAVATKDSTIPWPQPKPWRPYVIPDARGYRHSVSIDIELLQEVAAALGTTHITLKMKDSTSAILIHDRDAAWDRMAEIPGGILMPMRTGNTPVKKATKPRRSKIDPTAAPAQAAAEPSSGEATAEHTPATNETTPSPEAHAIAP